MFRMVISAGQVTPYAPNDYRNAENVKFNPTKHNFTHAALAMNEYSEPPDYCAGPLWAIFDADAVQREGWKVTPPYVDPDGYFFSANTLVELAAAIENEYQAKPMKGATLKATVERYNSFVDAGEDKDFGKPTPKYKIKTPPFYAAWATPVVHDTRAGLKNQCQVPGDRYERPGDPRSLLRRRVSRRFQPTRHGPLRDAGLHLRDGRCGGIQARVNSLKFQSRET